LYSCFVFLLFITASSVPVFIRNFHGFSAFFALFEAAKSEKSKKKTHFAKARRPTVP